MKIGVSVWRVLCKETKLKLLQNAMQESKSRFTKQSLSIAIKQQKGEVWWVIVLVKGTENKMPSKIF